MARRGPLTGAAGPTAGGAVRALIAGLVLLGAAAACGSPPPAGPAPHPGMLPPGAAHSEPDHGGSGHPHGQHPETGSGLTDIQEGFRLTDLAGPTATGSPGALSFRILDPTGAPQTRFEIEQTQPMHVYVVRTDLTDFYHVHPAMGADGRWSASLTVDRPGPYRVVTEFVAVTDRAPRRFVLGADLQVAGPYQPVPLPAPANQATVDAYTVTVEGEPVAGHNSPLDLRFTRGGEPVADLQPYLDTYAHVTAFHDGDLEVVHVHPSGPLPAADATGGPVLTVEAEFPTPGVYRTYIQFRTAGVVRTAPITLAVR